MKIFPILGALALLAACSGNKAADNTIEFETLADSAGYEVPGVYGADTAYAAAKYSVVWPEKIGQEDFDALRDSLMVLTFGVNSESIEEAARAFLLSPLEDLQENADSTIHPVKVPYPVAYDSPDNSMALLRSEVDLLTPDLLVVRVENAVSYFHAAHGMHTCQFLNYSIKDHLLLTPAVMFKPGTERSILSLIEQTARRRYPAEGVLFDDPITSFSNFEITEDEIIFVYQPYEIGPYSSGILEVPISQYDLYRFLTPTAIAALSL